MAYATNLEFTERSGIGIRVVDENVGTGDNSETSFDLDNDNVISESYVISYATSGSNSFTELTETTHYSLDKESGRIVLTTAGKTAVGTSVIYATYWYIESYSDSVLTDLISAADTEVDFLTGQRWTTATSVVEYYDGNRSSTYPTTDYPFQPDYDAPDSMVLKHFPVTKINFVYFLNDPQAISKFYNYDLGTTTYTDQTDEVNSSTETPFTLFNSSPATGDIIYIGSSNKFLGLDVNLSTVGTDNGSTAIDWEYWNGTTWADLTETDTDTGASIFTASGKFTWTYPFGWATTSVNSKTAYWIRGTLTDDYSVDPVCATITILDSVSSILEPRQYLFKSNGILTFTGTSLVNGINNVRVDYAYGMSSTPSYITELSILLASVKAYVGLSGGSYNDATSYTLGSKAVTIGEVYVNIREVIDQFKKRIQEILNMIGKRGDVCAI